MHAMSHNSDDKRRTRAHGAATACAGKVRFESFAHVSEAMNRIRQGKAKKRSAYACGFCQGFHIGSSNHVARSTPRRVLLARAVEGDE